MKRNIVLLIILLLFCFSYSKAQYGPVVSFSYDDGSDTWYNIGFPVFQEYGFPGVVYINATNWWIVGSGYNAIAHLHEMQTAGWEVSSHTYNHDPNITELSVSMMKNWLDSLGFPNSGFGAPENNWDHGKVNIVKKYHPYYMAATELPGMLPPYDPFRLQRINLTNSNNIAEVRGWLDDVVTNKKWIVFIAHEFGGTYGNPDDTWSQSDSLLRMVFNEVIARGIPVKTVREVMNDLYPPGLVIGCAEDSLQNPQLTYLEQQGLGNPLPLNPSIWNEYWHNTLWTNPRFVGSPVVYCHTSNDTLPVMKFFRNVPNGTYDVRASIIEYDEGRTYRLYYSYDSVNTSQYNVEVDKNSDVSLGTVTVSNGKFALYTQKADVVSGSDGFVGWAYIRLIPKPLLLSLKVFLEGPYNGSGAMTTTLNTQGLLPKYQPFRAAPWNYIGTEALATFPSNVVDWVMIELRSDLTTIVSRRAGLLLSDGSVVDIDGTSPVSFKDLINGNYYIVVRHRNHLPIMSANPVSLLKGSPVSYDFSTSQTQAYGTNPMKDLGGVIYGMIGGDTNSDGFIDILDFVGPDNQNFLAGYRNSDSNLDGFADIIDFILPDNNHFWGSNVP